MVNIYIYIAVILENVYLLKKKIRYQLGKCILATYIHNVDR